MFNIPGLGITAPLPGPLGTAPAFTDENPLCTEEFNCDRDTAAAEDADMRGETGVLLPRWPEGGKFVINRG